MVVVKVGHMTHFKNLLDPHYISCMDKTTDLICRLIVMSTSICVLDYPKWGVLARKNVSKMTCFCVKLDVKP